MTSTHPCGSTVEIVNDVAGGRRQTIHSPKTRAEIIEGFLFAFARANECEPDPIVACVHVYQDRLVLHFYANGDEEAAREQLRCWAAEGRAEA